MEAFLVMGKNVGVKVFTGAISGFLAKMKQGFSDITDDKILQITNNARIYLAKLSANCNTPESKTFTNDGETIIEQMLCEIKRNKKERNPNLLPPRMFENLSAIINAYSNDEYMSMKKSVYDNEKANARQALYDYALLNTTLNFGVDAAKEAIPELKNELKPPSSLGPQDVAAESAVTAAVASLINIKAGMVFLQKINDKINKEYIPDFNSLITMLASLQKELELASNDQTKIKEINTDMDKVNELIVKLCDAFDVLQKNELSRQIDGLATNFNEILKNYNLEKYDEVKFNTLKTKLDRIIQNKQIEKVRFEDTKNALGNAAEKFTQGFTQGLAQSKTVFGNVGNTIGNAASRIFGKETDGSNKENVRQPNGRRGGKRSRHNRKRKTQKQNKKTHKRRR